MKEATEGGFDLRRIGELLREAREKKGLSLSNVSDPLFLTKSTLGAIESGHWDVLPHPVYVKGYVKSYAHYLGVYKRVEEHLHPVETSESEGRDPFPGPRSSESDRGDQWMHCFWRVPLKNLALLCSSAVSLAFGMTMSTLPAFQEGSTAGLKDLIMAFRVVVTSL